MSSPLTLEAAPPVSVPFRFFVSGPLLGAAAGLLVALRGDVIVESRWALQSLAAVHLVTAGFMLQVMAGALLQFLPVAAGAAVWRPRLTGAVTHLSFLAGALALVAGFLGAGPLAFQAAALCLGGGATFFIAVAGVGLATSRKAGPTLPALRLAVAGLAVTVGLGVALLAGLGWAAGVPMMQLVHAHAAWSVLGWSATLVAGVAYMVVPMFQFTPQYSTKLAKVVPPALILAALAWTAGAWRGTPWLEWLGTAFGVLGFGGFAAETLWQHAHRRKRGVEDTTFFSWRLGMGCVLAAVALALAVRALPEGPWRIRGEYLLGVALFAGAFPALIGGMLYKIVPFLVWLHLHRVMLGAPVMTKVIPATHQRWQLRTLMVAVALLALAVAWPPLAIAGGVLFAAALLQLEVHLAQAWRLCARLMAKAKDNPIQVPHR